MAFIGLGVKGCQKREQERDRKEAGKRQERRRREAGERQVGGRWEANGEERQQLNAKAL
jgi:hypothetical protein